MEDSLRAMIDGSGTGGARVSGLVSRVQTKEARRNEVGLKNGCKENNAMVTIRWVALFDVKKGRNDDTFAC